MKQEIVTVEVADLEWEVVNGSSNMKLREEEFARAKPKTNRHKMETAKRMLLQGYKKNAIHKATGISRTAIDKYLTYFNDDVVFAIQKIHKIGVKTTQKNDLAFLLLFIHGGSSSKTTFLFFFLFLPLLAMGGGVLHYLSTVRERKIASWEIEKKHLMRFFRCVVDYRFNLSPIVCQSAKEVAYYKKILRHYKNANRPVELLPLEFSSEFDQKRRKIQDAYFLEKKVLYLGRGYRAEQYVQNLKDKGLLDYSRYQPWNPNWHKSRDFLYWVTLYIRQQPNPVYGNYKEGEEPLEADQMPDNIYNNLVDENNFEIVG